MRRTFATIFVSATFLSPALAAPGLQLMVHGAGPKATLLIELPGA